MKQRALESGLLQILRMYVISSAILLPLGWHTFSPMLGVEAKPDRFFPVSMPVMLFLVIYVTFPWWQRQMGHLFLPTALLLLAAQALLGSYLNVLWFVPPQSRDIAVLVFMIREWINIQLIVLLVAWQYDLFWVLVSGFGLSLIHAALNFSFINASDGTLYPLYAAIVSSQIVSVNATGLGLAWLMKRQREHRLALAEANQKLENANQKLVQYAATAEQLAVSQERIRLARELHDTLAHSLSSITVQLEAAESIWGVDMAKVHTLMDGALNNTRHGLTEARRALKALRSGTWHVPRRHVGI